MDGNPTPAKLQGLVARGVVGQVAGELLGVSPAGPRGGHPPVLGTVAHQLAGWSPASSWDDRPLIDKAAACKSLSWPPATLQGDARQVLGWSPANPWFLGWSPAGSWDGLPRFCFVLGGVVTRQPLSAGRNPETAGGTTKNNARRGGRPPGLGRVARKFRGWSPANPGDGRPPVLGLVNAIAVPDASAANLY